MVFQLRFAILAVFLLLLGVLADTNEEGLKFLEENKANPGVITLPSGLQYKVLRDGHGRYHPGLSSDCSCHYEGKLLDGTIFDSSYERGSPASFAPNQVIKGWTEAMQMMVEGDKWELYIPSELGYGDRGSPPKIPGGAVLVFTMEILDISGEIDGFIPAARCSVKAREKCNEKEAKYLDKIADWDENKISAETRRLFKVASSSMAPELASWVKKRLRLLKEISKKDDDSGEESVEPEVVVSDEEL